MLYNLFKSHSFLFIYLLAVFGTIDILYPYQYDCKKNNSFLHNREVGCVGLTNLCKHNKNCYLNIIGYLN